ncbi:MAG: FecR domain-containing protein [Kiritimatiellae bacterium]|nr:FecR domain-containing protein [Kiritimatiellia bacterium]
MPDEGPDELMGKYFEGVCSKAEKEVLVAFLTEEPASRRRFIRESYLRTEMRQWAKVQLAGAGQPAVERGAGVVRPERRRRQIRVADRRDPRWSRPALPGRRVGFGTRLLRVAACLALLAGGYLFYRHVIRPADPVVGRVRTAAESVVTRAELRIIAEPDLDLRVGDRIAVGERGRLELGLLGEPSTIAAHAGTELGVLGVERGKHFRLDAGTIDADIAPQPAGMPLVVDTPQAKALVVGTRFTLRAEPQRTRLEVQQGHVQLTRLSDQATVAVRAGQYAEAGPGLQLAARPLAPGQGARVAQGLVALYTFRESQGPMVPDESGHGRPLSLYIEDPQAVRWLPGGGLAVERPVLIASREPARKVTQACMASNELTVEAWVRPANVVQEGPARILSVSAGIKAMDFGLGQERDYWTFRVNVASAQSPTGFVWGEFHSAPRTLATRLTHVVWTRAARGQLACYVDARPVFFDGSTQTGAPRVQELPGPFTPWQPQFRLALANEFGDDRAWLGEYHLAAVYSRALSAAEVRKNFEAGASGNSSAGQPPLVRARQQ